MNWAFHVLASRALVDQKSKWVFFFFLCGCACVFPCFGTDVILFLVCKSKMLSTIALSCHCRSQGAIFSPSCPVMSPDGCRAALLQNMSRAGEEEVGVESGKGQRPKSSPHVSSCSHTLWHPSHAAGALKQVVKPPPTKRSNLFWNVFVYF